MILHPLRDFFKTNLKILKMTVSHKYLKDKKK